MRRSKTIADISTASVQSIASVHGISEDSAYSIKRIVDNLVSTTRKGAKIHLSEDNKSKLATDTIVAISKYRRSIKYIEECNALYGKHKKEIKKAINQLQSRMGFFKWLVSSNKNRQAAIEAYGLLDHYLKDSYYLNARADLKKLQEIQNSTSNDAWQDFSSNSIRFFNLLEDINPGILGTDDAVYGLPEDLAREIQAQDFFPQGLLCELRRYQEWGVKYALHQERVLLGDEMGLGKTIQAIATMVSLCNTGATHFLVVCPASVITNWCREIRKMSLLAVTKIHGTGREDALCSWLKTGGAAVTTYETTGHIRTGENMRFEQANGI